MQLWFRIGIQLLCINAITFRGSKTPLFLNVFITHSKTQFRVNRLPNFLVSAIGHIYMDHAPILADNLTEYQFFQ